MARRTEQRRAAVVALYQSDVTGRPAEELVERGASAFTRELVEGVERDRDALDEVARGAAGHVGLVQGDDRGPSLLSAPGHDRSRARDVFAGAGVHAHAVADVHEQWDSDDHA